MVYRTTLACPPRFQWEASSGSFQCSQAVNCGPTGSVQQADFYKDRTFPIERSRTRVGIQRCRPTTYLEQAAILRDRGVPCDPTVLTSLKQLDAALGPRPFRRPIGIGVLMSRMSAATRGHSFLGWHRITILARAKRRRKDGRIVRGYIYTDPNFSPPGGHRPDPKRGRRFIRRSELRYAFIENQPAIAIVPRRRKRID